MSITRNLIILIIGLFAFEVLNLNKVYTQNFTSEISLNKSTYLEGEPIWVTITIKNIGLVKDSLPMLNEDLLTKSLTITDTNGQVKIFLGGETEYIRKSYRILKPGDKYTFDIELLRSFGDKYEGSKACLPEGCLSTGTYKVQSDFKDVKTSLVRSNKLTFEVNKPEGNQEEALNTLRVIYKMKDRNDFDKLDKERAYKDFWLKYFESVYVELSYSLYSTLALFSNSDASESMIEESLEFIEKNPNSYFVKEYIWLGQSTIRKLNKGKTSEIQFLTSIMLKYPETKAYKEADIQIMQLNQ